MAELKITDLIDKGQIEEIVQLDKKLAALKETYVVVATKLAEGLKIEVNAPKDLDKLYELYNKQAAAASKTSAEFNATLEKQRQVIQEVADSLQKKVAAGELSAKDMKALTDASSKNTEALEKMAKAELAATKAQTAGNSSRKSATLSEEERLKVIKSAIDLTNQEIHSRSQAKEVNKQLQKAVDLLKDTDEGYITTLARLNSTIGINTDYVKRNSDRYTKQKMTIGAYREEVKAAIIELQNGNKSLNNFGIIAKGYGNILKSSFTDGFREVKSGVGDMVKGFVGAQGILLAIQKLIGLFKSGISAAIDFEAANSKLAAILGTTSNSIKELTNDAARLGKTTKYTASEATNLQVELAKLGFSKKEILESTEYILKFAQATGAELPEAAALAGAALRMFNADTSETERYVSAMAVATTKSALSFSYLQTAMPIVGPVAKAFNFQIEDTLALLGKLADAGFDASMAATATRNIFLNLADSNGKLAKSLGGPVSTLPELAEGLLKLKEQGIDLNSTLELTDKRSVAAFNAFLTAADKIVPLREQITGVDKELGDMAEEMNDNVKGALAGLSSAWESFMITIMGSNGVLRGAIEDLTSLVRGMRDVIATTEQLGQERLDSAKRIGQEAAKSDKDWVKSKLESVETVAFHYRKEGLDGEKAFEKARGEQLKILERSLTQEQARLDLYTNRNKKNWEEYNNSSFWKQGLGLQRATSAINDDINESFELIEQQTQFVESLKTKMEQIRELKNEYIASGNNTFTPTKTEKELKKEQDALEKAAKERQRILETMQQSELDLMDEGLQKELAKIALNYNKKIAAIRGNSEEEQKTRENLATRMQQDIGDYEVDFYLKKEQERIQNKLAVVKKGSDEEYELSLSLLKIQEEAEKESAIRNNEDILAVEEKYAKKRLELNENHAIEKNKKLEEEYAARIVLVNTAMGKELDELTAKYKKGEINAENYEKNKAAITRKYMLQQLATALELAKIMSDMPGLSDEDRLKMKQKVAEAEIALSNAVRDNAVADTEDAAKAHQKWLGEFSNSLDTMNDIARDALGDTANIFSGLSIIIEDIVKDGKLSLEGLAIAVIDVFSGLNDIVQNSYSARIEKIEEEQDANEEAKDKDIERIENLAEIGSISEEEAEARKRAAQDKTAAKNAELDKKKQAMAKKQATWDKATSIAQAGIATALAITKSLPNFILAAIVGAMGAIQIATIAATPIPSYAEGTKNGSHPGGKALVGDAGKHEVVMYNGLAWVTPNTPMMVDLPRGSKVFPDVDEMDMPDWNSLDLEMSFANHKFRGSKSDIERTTVINDFSRLEQKMDENNRLLAQRIKQQKKYDADRDFELYKLRKL
ncbi:phage tail tape measure protein [Bacteroides sp.]|uniref:phage tail tape measure protein n=1 Tax=Bacteroides sp. TaxID=29523 RepID=UPI00261967C5|nr:phage tail tape measure protein [Bacteroides sp.]